MRARAVSDFPEPLSPTIHNVSPGERSMFRFSTASSRSEPSGSAISRLDIFKRLSVNFFLSNEDLMRRSILHQLD